MTRPSRFLAALLAGCIGSAGFVHNAQAGLIGTEQVAASEGLRTAEQQRADVLAVLERADVAQALAERGVDLEQARARVAAMSDAEAAQVAAQIDSAPAGGSFLGSVIFIFV